MKLFPTVLLSFVAFTLIFSSGCRKDKFLDSGQLEFSTDTLTFDTVFTTLGSTTNYFKVFNKHKQKINISSVTLGGGSASNFRINVDGISADEVHDVEIGGEDSIYVFVEVTVDPNGINTPLVILDSVVFITNGNFQRVILEAWGQDAHFYKNVIACDETLQNDKPHVILNTFFVDSGCVLNIDAGTQIYMGGSAQLVVYGTAQIHVNGTVDNPVVFQGIRLEEFYDDLPGQWNGIFILRGSTGNTFNNVIIKNSDFGIHLGGLPPSDDINCSNINTYFSAQNLPEALIQNTIIQNSFVSGLTGLLADITVKNCLIFNSGENAVSLGYGGIYDFTNCTFANYGSVTINHQKPVVLLSNVFACEDNTANSVYTADLFADFYNTIVHGSLENEIELVDTIAAFNVTFDHCLLKTNIDTPRVTFINVIKNEDPLFTDRDEEDDYTLLENSPCINAGNTVNTTATDLAGKARDGQPDIGAYEF